MKTRLHQWMLGWMLLLILPGTLLACLLVISALGSGLSDISRARGLAGILFMLAVPALFGWGIHLFRILGSGYIASTRYRLLAFHLADFVFCGAWLMSSFSRNGNSGMIFSPGIRTVGFTILLIPVFTVLFTSPTIQPDPVAPLARAFSPNRASRRLVAWLAARIR